MFKNYLKTALRALLKSSGFTFINIFGLGLGLTAFFLIILYVNDELNFDRFNIKHDRIYRVNTALKYGLNETSFAITAPPVADAMARELPEVEMSMRIGQAVNLRFKKGEEVMDEKGGFYCDNNIFKIFTLPMLYGDPKTALAEHNAIVLSRSLALKYFSTTNVVGRTLQLISDTSEHKITGVMEDMPAQSHFKADLLLAMDPNRDNSWAHFNTGTYILLKPGVNTERLTSKLNDFARRHLNSAAFNYDKFAASGNYIRLDLTPITEIHLHSNRQREFGINGDVQYVYIFASISIFILVLACINFMNLSTARSANRAREVGVRKVLGSPRKHLIFQFLLESLLITLIAGVIALVATWALLPLFNYVSGKTLAVTGQIIAWLLPVLFIIVLLVGVLAGCYPAFYLSSFNPVQVLKGKLATGFKGSSIRNFLVVFQFSISIFLIIGTLVIYNQLAYIRNKDLGYHREQVIVIKNLTAVANPGLFKTQVKQLAGVANATLTHYLPTNPLGALNYISTANKKQIETQFWPVDADYISTMGMQIIKGRNFDERFLTDSAAVVINETLAKTIGYQGQDGMKISTMNKDYRVIGVIKDFNFASLRENITPLVLTMNSDWLASLSVRVKTTNLPALMRQIESTWRGLANGQHIEYSFMDDDFNALYNNEQRMGSISLIFTVLAIVVACLGLFGLAAYAAEQRLKEVSIRKLLGASVKSITVMLSKDLMSLVLISMLIAAPLAWIVMNKWLQGFAYRQGIPWWIFGVTGVCALLIATVTVSYQSIKAALVNPADNLRGD